MADRETLEVEESGDELARPPQRGSRLLANERKSSDRRASKTGAQATVQERNEEGEEATEVQIQEEGSQDEWASAPPPDDDEEQEAAEAEGAAEEDEEAGAAAAEDEAEAATAAAAEGAEEAGEDDEEEGEEPGEEDEEEEGAESAVTPKAESDVGAAPKKKPKVGDEDEDEAEEWEEGGADDEYEAGDFDEMDGEEPGAVGKRLSQIRDPFPDTDEKILEQLLDASKQAYARIARIEDIRAFIKEYEEVRDQEGRPKDEKQPPEIKKAREDLIKELEKFDAIVRRIDRLCSLTNVYSPEDYLPPLQRQPLADAVGKRLSELMDQLELEKVEKHEHGCCAYCAREDQLPKMVVCGTTDHVPMVVFCDPGGRKLGKPPDCDPTTCLKRGGVPTGPFTGVRKYRECDRFHGPEDIAGVAGANAILDQVNYMSDEIKKLRLENMKLSYKLNSMNVFQEVDDCVARAAMQRGAGGAGPLNPNVPCARQSPFTPRSGGGACPPGGFVNMAFPGPPGAPVVSPMLCPDQGPYGRMPYQGPALNVSPPASCGIPTCHTSRGGATPMRLKGSGPRWTIRETNNFPRLENNVHSRSLSVTSTYPQDTCLRLRGAGPIATSEIKKKSRRFRRCKSNILKIKRHRSISLGASSVLRLRGAGPSGSCPPRATCPPRPQSTCPPPRPPPTCPPPRPQPTCPPPRPQPTCPPPRPQPTCPPPRPQTTCPPRPPPTCPPRPQPTCPPRPPPTCPPRVPPPKQCGLTPDPCPPITALRSSVGARGQRTWPPQKPLHTDFSFGSGQFGKNPWLSMPIGAGLGSGFGGVSCSNCYPGLFAQHARQPEPKKGPAGCACEVNDPQTTPLRPSQDLKQRRWYGKRCVCPPTSFGRSEYCECDCNRGMSASLSRPTGWQTDLNPTCVPECGNPATSKGQQDLGCYGYPQPAPCGGVPSPPPTCPLAPPPTCPLAQPPLCPLAPPPSCPMPPPPPPCSMPPPRPPCGSKVPPPTCPPPSAMMYDPMNTCRGPDPRCPDMVSQMEQQLMDMECDVARMKRELSVMQRFNEELEKEAKTGKCPCPETSKCKGEQEGGKGKGKDKDKNKDRRKSADQNKNKDRRKSADQKDKNTDKDKNKDKDKNTDKDNDKDNERRKSADQDKNEEGDQEKKDDKDELQPGELQPGGSQRSSTSQKSEQPP